MHLTQIQDGQGTLSVDFCVFLVCVNFHKGLQYFYYILFKKKNYVGQLLYMKGYH